MTEGLVETHAHVGPGAGGACLRGHVPGPQGVAGGLDDGQYGSTLGASITGPAFGVPGWRRPHGEQAGAGRQRAGVRSRDAGTQGPVVGQGLFHATGLAPVAAPEE